MLRGFWVTCVLLITPVTLCFFDPHLIPSVMYLLYYQTNYGGLRYCGVFFRVHYLYSFFLGSVEQLCFLFTTFLPCLLPFPPLGYHFPAFGARSGQF